MTGKEFKNAADVNPFFIYIAGFTLALLVYQLDWSYLYPPLSFSLILFLLVTFIISGIIGFYIHKKGILRFMAHRNTLNTRLIIVCISIGYLLEFLYARQIPLLSILKNSDVDYQDFGIPTFHVVLVTFTSFYSVYLFYCYIVEKKKAYLFYGISLFIFPILIFSRGTILLNLSSIFFVYLFSIQKNKLRVYFKIMLIIFVVLMGFGILGNIRTSNQIDKNGTVDLNDIMLGLGEAKPAFENSAIPKAYFWSYLYISSPLANLQCNINQTGNLKYDLPAFAEYLNSEVNFDFISKRIDATFGLEKPENKLIAPFLTVGTIYSTSYSYVGWIGMSITFVALMLISLLYIAILKPDSPFFVTAISILNTMILFSLFDNMIAFSGLSFQLIYPLLLSVRLKKA